MHGIDQHAKGCLLGIKEHGAALQQPGHLKKRSPRHLRPVPAEGAAHAVLPCKFRFAALGSLNGEESFGKRGRPWATKRRARAALQRCPYAPRSTAGSRPGGRHAAETVRSSAVRNRNKSQEFPEQEPNGSRIPLACSSLPPGTACNASGACNRVPDRTPDRQR